MLQTLLMLIGTKREERNYNGFASQQLSSNVPEKPGTIGNRRHIWQFEGDQAIAAEQARTTALCPIQVRRSDVHNTNAYLGAQRSWVSCTQPITAY